MCLNNNGFYKDQTIINVEVFNENNIIDMKSLAKEFIMNNYYVKSIRCNNCIKNKICNGMHINFIRTYKFNILKEIN